jgi:hypothetical protein
MLEAAFSLSKNCSTAKNPSGLTVCVLMAGLVAEPGLFTT